jgi:hypothetical protein
LTSLLSLLPNRVAGRAIDQCRAFWYAVAIKGKWSLLKVN